MAGEPEVKSVPGLVWGLHPDQSYKGKPVDPDVVARVRTTLDKFRGPRSMAERESIIAAKVKASKTFDASLSAEYWAWARRVKEESLPVFQLPPDGNRGKLSQEEYIQARVDEGLRDMRRKSIEYKQWVESMAARKQAEQLEMLEAKASADESYKAAAEEREEARRQHDAEYVQQVRQEEAQYWKWHTQMKERVKQRPSSAPAARSSGVESPAAMAQKKKADSIRIYKTMALEYNEWLRDASQPKFKLPLSRVDHEGIARREAAAQERIKQARKEEVKYFKEVQQMRRKHHTRIMGMVQERLDADKVYAKDHELAAQTLAGKLEAEKRRQREISAKSRKELKSMYKRMKERPLQIEVAYSNT